MPAVARARVLLPSKYVAGILGAGRARSSGLWLRATGRIPATARGILTTSASLPLIGWVALSFACGWIGAGFGPVAAPRRDDDSRLLAGVLAVIMMPVSCWLLTFAAIVVPLAQGDPRDFQTIRKTRGTP